MKDQEKENAKNGVDGLDDETDWDKAYQAFLAQNPDVQKKIDAGGATKEDVIAWMKKNPGLAEKVNISLEKLAIYRMATMGRLAEIGEVEWEIINRESFYSLN